MTTVGEQTSGTATGGASMETQTRRLSDLGDRAQRILNISRIRRLVRENLLIRGKEAVRQDPLRAVLVAFALGIVFGRRSGSKMMVMRRHYVAVNRTQAGILGMLMALGMPFRRLFRATPRLTGGTLFTSRRILARRSFRPWGRIARRAGHRLHLFR